MNKGEADEGERNEAGGDKGHARAAGGEGEGEGEDKVKEK